MPQIDALEKKVNEKETEKARSEAALKKYKVRRRARPPPTAAADKLAGSLASGAHRARLGGQ